MIQYILDTDHLTLWQRSHVALTQRITEVGLIHIAVTVITVEEHLLGWLSEVRKASKLTSSPNSANRLAWAYQNLRESVQSFHRLNILDFTNDAQTQFIALRQQGIRIGTQDLRIAAIALEQNLTVVTRNRQDFEQVPDLRIADWTQA